MFESPIVVRGALISLIEDTVMTFTPNIVFFQYNPAKLSRSLEVHTAETPAGEAPIAPGVQPLMPKETIDLELELDASDGLERGWPLETAFGVSPRIAAIEKMTMPSKGLLGDLVASVGNIGAALGADYTPPVRTTVPVSLFIWGPAKFSPVRVMSYSIEEQLFSPYLYPLQAKVTLSLEVITPASFRCSEDNAIITFAKAFYELNRMQQDALAIANLANAVTDIMNMVAPP